MKKRLALITVLLAAFAAPGAYADDDGLVLRARLIGYEEVPSVSTPARGRFVGAVNEAQTAIDYELTYTGLLGTVQQSHIHVAQRGVNGSIVIWLCQTATTPAPAAVAALTPFCPPDGTVVATVTGTITAANVINASITSQQITAGELDEVLAAIRAGVSYVNVHTTPLNPGGEIRGQIRVRGRDRDDD